MTYSAKAVEWAMRVQEVFLRAMSGRQPWLQVAEVLGLSPRMVRRWRWRYEQYGCAGLFDRRRRVPSARRGPPAPPPRPPPPLPGPDRGLHPPAFSPRTPPGPPRR